VVDHFVHEGIAWQTIYNALNRRKNGQSILCDTHLGPRRISIPIVGGKEMKKCFCFDGENMPNCACYCTEDKSKLLDDVSFIKKYNYPK
jgi:hypothetical protein